VPVTNEVFMQVIILNTCAKLISLFVLASSFQKANKCKPRHISVRQRYHRHLHNKTLHSDIITEDRERETRKLKNRNR